MNIWLTNDYIGTWDYGYSDAPGADEESTPRSSQVNVNLSGQNQIHEPPQEPSYIATTPSYPATIPSYGTLSAPLGSYQVPQSLSYDTQQRSLPGQMPALTEGFSKFSISPPIEQLGNSAYGRGAQAQSMVNNFGIPVARGNNPQQLQVVGASSYYEEDDENDGAEGDYEDDAYDDAYDEVSREVGSPNKASGEPKGNAASLTSNLFISGSRAEVKDAVLSPGKWERLHENLAKVIQITKYMMEKTSGLAEYV